jgi:hypothetical protein
VGIAPSFDPPHVRVLLNDADMDAAFQAMSKAGLDPTIHSAVTVSLPNASGSLKTAWDVLSRMGYLVEAILVVPSCEDPSEVQVSFGISQLGIADWTDSASDALGEEIRSNF